MPVEFASAAKSARSQIPVPPLNINAIREQARASGLRERLRAAVLSSTIGIAALGTAAALASNAGGVRVWLFGNKTAAVVDSFAQVREPMPADVRAIVNRASFAVLLPARVPRALRVQWIAYAPADRPNFVQIQYRDPAGKQSASVAIIETTAIQTGSAALPPGVTLERLKQGRHWRAGSETVLLGGDISATEAAMIRSAMRNETPAQGIADLDSHLRKMIVLGVDAQFADSIEKFVPPGRDVLFNQRGIALIRRLAGHGQPLRDYRTVDMVNVPSVNGQPDYAQATLRWPNIIAIPAAGVRAIAAVLRATGTTSACNCAIFFHQGSRSEYWVWKIAPSTPPHIAKYVVNARTLKVSAE
jgi:hypothetical protein